MQYLIQAIQTEWWLSHIDRRLMPTTATYFQTPLFCIDCEHFYFIFETQVTCLSEKLTWQRACQDMGLQSLCLQTHMHIGHYFWLLTALFLQQNSSYLYRESNISPVHVWSMYMQYQHFILCSCMQMIQFEHSHFSTKLQSCIWHEIVQVAFSLCPCKLKSDTCGI